MDPNLFHPEHGQGHVLAPQAKAVCAECEVRADCLEFALEHEEAHGIWGGLGVPERRKILSQRRRDS